MEMREKTAPAKPDYDVGLKLLSEQKFEEALKEFRRVVSVDPEHANANFQVGRLLLEGHRADQALHSFARAAEIVPNSPQVWAGWAEAVALGGTADERQTFMAALGSANLDTKLKIMLQDRFGANRKATRPEKGGLPTKRAGQLLKLLQSGKFKEAEAAARRALAEFPRSAAAANILAVAQDRQNKSDRAIASCIQAIKLDPGYSEAYENLGRFLLKRQRLNEAIANLKKAVILSPDRATALAVLGSALNQIGKHEPSLILLERAVSLDKRSFGGQIELGNAYTRTGKPEQAVEAYKAAKALAVGKISNDHLTALGQAQAKIGDFNAALDNFEAAIADDPNFGAAISAKAQALQSLGKFTEAQETFRRAIECDPTVGENYRSFVHSYRVTPDDPILDQMIGVFGSSDLTDTSRVHLGFAIAKALEDTGDFERVFEYLNIANGLNAKHEPFHAGKRRLEVNAFKNAYRDFDFKTGKGISSSAPDPIFVTGMPRSGTTLIEQIIASHSTVSSAGETAIVPKLCHALVIYQDHVRKLDEISLPELENLRADYQETMQKRLPDASLYTDKTITTYMHIGLLKLAMPNARFIVVRRDPRDNLLSMYKNKFPEGTHPYAYDLEDLAHYYGTFVEMIDFWRERIPDWFYEVQYETLVSNPEEESRKLIDACGLEWEDACLNFHQNKNKVQTLSVYQVRQPISKGSVKGWKRYEKELEPMLKILREAGHVTD